MKARVALVGVVGVPEQPRIRLDDPADKRDISKMDCSAQPRGRIDHCLPDESLDSRKPRDDWRSSLSRIATRTRAYVHL